jgi:type IV pilus assembly protein PilN
MAKINLLPWRETKRKEKQQEFLVMLGAGAALAILVVLLVQFQFDRKITNQERRNQLLTNEIKILDNDIKEIQKLDATRRNLIDRMEVIQNLQTTRPGIVHLFDEIATTIPAGLHLSSLSQSGDTINITGRAESNARVSSYMRNIEKSEWLTNPKLTVITTNESASLRLSDFTLVVEQSKPEDDIEDES